MRSLSPAAITAIDARTAMVALLVEMDLDGGAMYLNQSRLNLVVQGTTYAGTHGLGQVSECANQGGELPKLAFEMSGAPSDKVALALSEPVQGRAVRIKLALYDTATGEVLDVSLRYSGYLDVMALDDGTERATLSVTSEAGMRDLLRACNVLYSHVDQTALVPGDLFYQYTNAQVEQKIVFPARHWFIAHKE